MENLTYGYDVLGNVKSRTDSAVGLTEKFGYDPLNRLTSAQMVNVPTMVAQALNSDPFANLTWAYGAPGGTRPHAITPVRTLCGRSRG